jgi:hypothetical protein
MSTTKLAKVRTLVLGGAAAAAVALPLTLATGPAHASTSLNGCTVTPLRPDPAQILGGQVTSQYRTRVTCVANRIVQIVDRRYEADAPAGIGGDDFYGARTYLHTFASPGTVILSTRDVVDNTEVGNEETYHRTSFRVASINGVVGPTAFEDSPVRSVAN